MSQRQFRELQAKFDELAKLVKDNKSAEATSSGGNNVELEKFKKFAEDFKRNVDGFRQSWLETNASQNLQAWLAKFDTYMSEAADLSEEGQNFFKNNIDALKTTRKTAVKGEKITTDTEQKKLLEQKATILEFILVGS